MVSLITRPLTKRQRVVLELLRLWSTGWPASSPELYALSQDFDGSELFPLPCVMQRVLSELVVKGLARREMVKRKQAAKRDRFVWEKRWRVVAVYSLVE